MSHARNRFIATLIAVAALSSTVLVGVAVGEVDSRVDAGLCCSKL